MKTLLGIFSPGATEITVGLTLFTLLVVGVLWYQAFKAAKSGGTQQVQGGQQRTDHENTSVWGLWKFRMGLAVIVLWIVA